MALKDGTKVKVEYEGKIKGKVFDSSEKHGKPLEFTIGKKQVIPGFEKAVKDMKKGDEKEIKIKAKDAYGEKRDDMKKEVPRSSLPGDKEPKKGMGLMIKTPNGKQIPGKIVKVDKENITLDLNHPLAGKDLDFKIKLLEVNSD